MVSSYLATTIVDPVFADPARHSALEVLFAAWGFAVVIYADFSGYTDIAIGIAKLLGFQFPQNFDRPYSARSLQDFWRRWHITLSRWLRDYLYIPLGGSKKGEIRTYVNIMVTMVLGGLWHGAAWTFVFWGALHGSRSSGRRLEARPSARAPEDTPALRSGGSGSPRSTSCASAGSSSARTRWRPRSRCWAASFTGWTTPTSLVSPLVVFVDLRDARRCSTCRIGPPCCCRRASHSCVRS